MTFRLFSEPLPSDNDSEFAGLHEALKDTFDVYFSHPDVSFEQGTSENQHKFIHHFIPKGNPISQFTEPQYMGIQQWMNNHPRKKLDYRTPHEHFVNSLRLERQAV